MAIAFSTQPNHWLQLSRCSVVIATVIQTQGSTPRETGAKMIITSDGQTFETIGGGAGEAKVIDQVQTVLATGKPKLVDIDLSGSSQWETQGICGGTMQVWLARWQGEAAIALTHTILQLLTSGQSATLATPLTEQSPYLVEATNFQLVRNGKPHYSSQAVSDSDEIYGHTCGHTCDHTCGHTWIELIQPPPLLLIVGAGHCGIQLAKVADLIGFQIAIQDDRPDWANAENYPQATFIFNQSIDEAIAQFTQHPQLYAALVTRSYQHDVVALTALLQRQIPCQYIGMMGSQRRVQQVYRAIAQLGISEEKLRSIHAPIGLNTSLDARLDIGALTPAEIAVSISAELILVRRKNIQQV
jgi:xanthine dehydrogenase accessory factor